METTPLRAQILDTIIRKSTLKQRVFDNTFGAFNSLKETLLEMASEMDDELDGKLDRRVRLEYRDRGKFEAQPYEENKRVTVDQFNTKMDNSKFVTGKRLATTST